LDLVVFEVGGLRFGADAARVVRVAPRDPKASSRLGPGSSRRALVVDAGGDGERQVPIDRLVGFIRAGPDRLRRLPEFVRGLAEPALLGFRLEERDEIVLLVDLEALVKQQPSAAP